MISIIVSYIQARLPQVRSERGQDLIEYALLGGLIAAGLVAIVALFGGALTTMAGNIRDCIDFTGTTVCDAGP